MKIVLILSNSTSDAVELTGQSSVMSFDGEHAEVRLTLDPSEYDKLGVRPSLVDDHARGPDTPAQPVSPVEDPDQEYIYRITEQGKGASDFTIESYTAMGWTLENLVEAGHVDQIPVESTVEKSAPAPAAPEPEPAPPSVPEPEPVFKMTAMASGSTKQAFLDLGWTEGQMVVEGFAEWVAPEPLVGSTVYTGPWPQDLGGDRWINQHGEEFDASQHARTRNTPPKVKVDGHWKAKVGTGKAKTPVKVVPTPAAIVGTTTVPITPQAPAAPSADSALNAGAPPPPASINASTAPPAPSAPNVPGVPKAPNAPEVAGATEDADVASILDNWGSTDAPTL